MDLLDRYRSWINDKHLDHVKFIQSLLLVIVITILFMYLWIIVMTWNEYFSQDFFIFAIQGMTRGLILGGIGGIVLGFLILLPWYIRKQWDEHVVVPHYLLLTTSLIGLLIVVGLFIPIEPIFKISFTIGFVLGSMIALLAYIGEIKKEHTEEE